MDAGYETPDAFARAFRQRFRQSPSSFRKSPDWEPWLSAFGPLDNARNKIMQKTFTNDDVTIRDVHTTRVAIMEHRGDPATLGATIQRFIAWRKASGLHPKTSPTFNVWRSERRPASPADYSVDLCVGTDQPIDASGEPIKLGEIPGGRCAVLRVVGNTDNLEPAALYLYREWLPASGEDAARLPDLLPAAKFLPRGARTRDSRGTVLAAEIAPSDSGLHLTRSALGRGGVNLSMPGADVQLDLAPSGK